MNYKRINVEVDQDDHKKAKIKLAVLGKTIAEWIREELRKFINT